jgi:hypothetical protein
MQTLEERLDQLERRNRRLGLECEFAKRYMVSFEIPAAVFFLSYIDPDYIILPIPNFGLAYRW